MRSVSVTKYGLRVAAVELHALDHFQLRLHGLRLFDGDDAVLADLLHRFGDDGADLRVGVGGDGADLGDHVARDGLGELRERAANSNAMLVALADDGLNGLVDAALQRHRVCARGHCLYALAVDRLGEHGRGGGAVAGHVGGFGSYLAHHLRTHILEQVAKLDFLSYGDAVLGDDGRTELPFNDDVASLGAERNLHRVGQNVYSTQNCLA